MKQLSYLNVLRKGLSPDFWLLAITACGVLAAAVIRFKGLLELTPEQVEGVTLAALGALITGMLSQSVRRAGDFVELQRIRSDLAGIGINDLAHVQHMPLPHAINHCIRKMGHTNNLLVLASTGQSVIDAVRMSNASIEHCSVLLEEIDSSIRDARLLRVRERITDNVQGWIELIDDPSLDVRSAIVAGIPFTPTCFHVIFDKRLMVFGPYVPSKLSTNRVKALAAWVVDGSTSAGAEMITQHIGQHQLLFQEYPKYNGIERRAERGKRRPTRI